MKKRGRPPKNSFDQAASTIETDLARSACSDTQDLITKCKEIIAEHRKGLGKGQFISDDILLAFAEIGGDHLQPSDEKQIDANYEWALERASKLQTNATNELKKITLKRAKNTWQIKNQDLVSKLKPNGHLSLNQVTKKILADWGVRGDDLDLKKPSAHTLRNWYNLLHPKK